MQAFYPLPFERRRFLTATRGVPETFSRSARRLPPVFVFTDPQRTPDPAGLASNIPRGWGLVYRHFGSADRGAVARDLARIARDRRFLLLISADPKLAEDVEADGVHWPENRLPMTRRSDRRWIVSASAHSRRSINRAEHIGVDLIFLSKIFASRSSAPTPALGLLRFASVSSTARTPIWALGGINSTNIGRVLKIRPHKIRGVAGIDGIVSTLPEPKQPRGIEG